MKTKTTVYIPSRGSKVLFGQVRAVLVDHVGYGSRAYDEIDNRDIDMSRVLPVTEFKVDEQIYFESTSRLMVPDPSAPGGHVEARVWLRATVEEIRAGE